LSSFRKAMKLAVPPQPVVANTVPRSRSHCTLELWYDLDLWTWPR